MLRQLQICCAITVFPLLFSAQDFDEKAFLKSLPKLKNDSNKVNKLIAYCNYLIKSENPQKALGYTDTTARLAKKIKFTKGELGALSMRSTLCFSMNDFENALNADRRRLEKYQELNHQEGIAAAREAIGTDFVKLNKGDSALYYFKLSLETLKSTGSKTGAARVNGYIGNIYLVKQDYGKALTYSKESLKTYEELKDKNGLRSAYTDLMHIYNEIGNTMAATDYEQKITRINKELASQ
jgi:tetratricopeptide (TPR) repeat protein